MKHCDLPIGNESVIGTLINFPLQEYIVPYILKANKSIHISDLLVSNSYVNSQNCKKFQLVKSYYNI